MDWELFDTRGENKREAFEALVCHLFEHFCRRTFGPDLITVQFVNGDGGDGSVEAYALVRRSGMADLEEIGVQAKWFPAPLANEQLRQIGASFRTARAQRGRRLARYYVAVPRRLGDKRKGTKKSERERWDEWVERVKRDAPGTDIDLWDEIDLEKLLSEPENEGLQATWFKGSVFTWQDLEDRFDRARNDGWLRLRYLPELHATMEIEQDLAVRLGDPAARAWLVRQVDTEAGRLRASLDDVSRLPRYPGFMALSVARDVAQGAVRAFKKILAAGDELAEALRRGHRLMGPMPVDPEDDQAIRRLHVALAELDRKAKLSRAPTHGIREQLDGCLREGMPASFVLRDLWNTWLHAPVLVAYVGPAGMGKTHGLAHVIGECFNKERPALLLRALDCPVEQGWAEILRHALDRPGARLDELLNAMEATAVRADVRRARSASAATTPGSIEPEPTCFLLAIDGIEEAGRHRRWAERLGELAGLLEDHPRLRAAVTLRTASAEEILGHVRRDRFVRVDLDADEDDIERLLVKYCTAYAIELPDRRLRWAIRDRLSVRLYCDLKKRSPSAMSRSTLSLPHLLAKKIDLAEDEIRNRGGHGRDDEPLHAVLRVITGAVAAGGRLRREEVITGAAKELPGFTDWGFVLDQAEEQGLLLVSRRAPADPLAPPAVHIEPADEPLTDYLIAKRTSEDIASRLARDSSEAGSMELPPALRQRRDARTQTALLLLSEHRISLVQLGLFRASLVADEIEHLELRAIAALDVQDAVRYRDWVRERLVASMPSCRRVLKELCVPVALDPQHPFAPRFVHDTLVPFLPTKRDFFWSGPRLLPAGGAQPWEGHGDEALENLSLHEEDVAEGPPLLFAWALTSVDNRWRARVRAELAKWGGANIEQLTRWLEIVTESNDPQMIEDVAMVAFGAAILAGTDRRLVDLVRWVDQSWLTPGSAHRREDIVVLHAARGIVERARVMGLEVGEATLARARRPYGTSDAKLPRMRSYRSTQRRPKRRTIIAELHRLPEI